MTDETHIELTEIEEQEPRGETRADDHREPLSPFLPWSPRDREPVQAAAPGDEYLVLLLLQDPEAIVDRVLQLSQAQRVTMTSIAVIALCGAATALAMTAAMGDPWEAALLSAAMVPLASLGALAAVIAPVYGVGVAEAVRMPIAQLVAVLTAATAAATMVLLALAPAPYVLWQLDPEWAGPLAVVGAFFFSGVACAMRFWALLKHLVERAAHAPQDGEGTAVADRQDRRRVAAFVRISMLLLFFCNTLAGWAWFAVR